MDVLSLDGKNAVIYGGGGNIGGAVARAFAAEGAAVHLAGRTLATLEQVAAPIREKGGTATVAQVDALDEAAVDAHADGLVGEHGSLDISMNLISTGDVQGTPLVEMALTAVEALRNQLASELGPHGIRVVSLLTGGVIDAIPADFAGRDALAESLVEPTLLGRGATLDDVGNVAAFVASSTAGRPDFAARRTFA